MLAAIDLLEPRGELDAEVLWPGVDRQVVEAKIEKYLEQGYVKAAAISDADDLDEAARQWAYHRAKKGVYQRVLAMPSTVSTADEGSSTYLRDQIVSLGEEAELALSKFNELLATVVTEDVESYAVIRRYR